VAVVIRMKRMGRTHRAFFRICAADRKSPRDGRVIEELGTYDPSVSETDARCALKGERVAYWLSVGAQPSPKVSVLIKKYGLNGTHLKQMEEARARLAMPRLIPEAGEPVFIPEEKPAEPPAEETTDAAGEAAVSGEAPATEEASAESVPAPEAAGEQSVEAEAEKAE
jgi:small subunit ribosomal protein S16